MRLDVDEKTAETIELTNSGPIEGTFVIDLSMGPGAYEFRGARGTGKTTCISSIDWLAGHKVDVTLHDAAVSGRIEGFGVVAPVGGRKRRKGDFGLDTIDAEKFSLTDLVDPPGKTPEVRDAHAIKALAVLSEAKAEASLYYEVAGSQKAFDGLGIQQTTDPVLLATRIKQAFDKIARERQNTAEAEAGHAAPLEVVPEGLDMSQSSDLSVLANVRDEARDDWQALRSDWLSGQKAHLDAAEAKKRLSKLQAAYQGWAVDEAQAHVDTACKEKDKAEDDALGLKEYAASTIADIKVDLDAAIRKLEDDARNQIRACETRRDEAAKVAHQASSVHQVATEQLATATQHEEAIHSLQEAASLTPAYASAEDIAAAENAVDVASLAYDQGLRIRDVEQNQEKAKAHREAAKDAENAANEARNKAQQVFDVLAQSLHTQHLEIQSVDGNPRLFVQHPKRGKTAFDRVNGLSDGERVDFTLRELLPHIDSPGLLPIPQRVWQDLQPTDRENLHELATKRGLYLFGAQVDDGELRVVFMGDESE